MNLFTDNEILFRPKYLIKRLIISLQYSILLAVGAVFSIGLEKVDFIALAMYLFLPSIILLSAFVIKRCKWTLLKIDLSEIDENIILIYQEYSTEKKIVCKKIDFHVKLDRDPASLFEYYILNISVSEKLLLKQYQKGDWSKEAFIDLVQMLKQESIKCVYPSLKKEIDSQE